MSNEYEIIYLNQLGGSNYPLSDSIKFGFSESKRDQIQKEITPYLKQAKKAASKSQQKSVALYSSEKKIAVMVPEEGNLLLECDPTKDSLHGNFYQQIKKVQDLANGFFGVRKWLITSQKEDELANLKRFGGTLGLAQLLPGQAHQFELFYLKHHGIRLDRFKPEKKSVIKEMVVKACQELRSGLKAIHEKGLLHNDLHAGNILISWNEKKGKLHATLIDFGQMSEEPSGALVSEQWERERLESHIKELYRRCGYVAPLIEAS